MHNTYFDVPHKIDRGDEFALSSRQHVSFSLPYKNCSDP